MKVSVSGAGYAGPVTGTRLGSLTGLKVIALWLIFYWHSNLPKCNVDLGARCCEFFFIVSGFLVAYHFQKKHIEISLSASWIYFRQKLIQIYPLHFLTMFILIAFGISKIRFTTFSFNLLLLQSWVLDKKIYFAYNGISWFVSSLLFCYFCAPLFMYFIRKNIKDVIKVFLLVLFLRIVLEGLPLTTTNKLWVLDYHVNPVIRSLEFLSGMLLVPFYFSIKKYLNKQNDKIAFSLIEALSVIFFITICYYTKFIRGIYVMLWCFIVLVFSFNAGICSKLLSSDFFKFFGQIQLSFYMFHQVVIKLFLRYGKNTTSDILLQNVIIFIIVCIVSCFYTNCLEKTIISKINHVI